MTLPTLKTARLVLQPLSFADVDRLHQLWTNPDVRRYLWDDVVIPRERAEDTVRQCVNAAALNGVGMWTVVDAGSGALAGFCGFMRRAPDEDIELMYGLAPQFWGRGFATEAAGAAMCYAFETLGCERISAVTDFPNAASVRVMERLGFRFVRRGPLNDLDTLFYEIERSAFAIGPHTARR